MESDTIIFKFAINYVSGHSAYELSKRQWSDLLGTTIVISQQLVLPLEMYQTNYFMLKILFTVPNTIVLFLNLCLDIKQLYLSLELPILGFNFHLGSS